MEIKPLSFKTDKEKYLDEIEYDELLNILRNNENFKEIKGMPFCDIANANENIFEVRDLNNIYIKLNSYTIASYTEKPYEVSILYLAVSRPLKFKRYRTKNLKPASMTFKVSFEYLLLASSSELKEKLIFMTHLFPY